MKHPFSKEAIETMGNLLLAAIHDCLLEHKMPQVVLRIGSSKKDEKFARMVVLDNRVRVMDKEEIAARIAALKAAPGNDVGFSYTSNGIRIIVVPEDMTIIPVLGAPLGTPFG